MVKKYSVKDTTHVEYEKIANNALVKASDEQYSEHHYLEEIFKDAIMQR